MNLRIQKLNNYHFLTKNRQIYLSFFYILLFMKIYIDLVLFINFLYDFVILLTINILFKRNSKLHKIIFSSIIGSLSIFIYFININKIIFLLIKIITIIIMLIISFNFNNFIYLIKNILSYYIISFILRGNLYYLSNKFNTSNVINIFLLLFSPIILIIYIKQIKSIKTSMNIIKKVKVYFKDKEINLNGYIDTGNNLSSNISKRMVFISNNKLIKKQLLKERIYLVPFNTINSSGLIKCIKPSYVIVEDYGKFNNILIGYINNDLSLENADVILNKRIMEE